jgi:3-hydroxyisobutyrate dehydrogenase-like beta-hydroxyacid dehydrogenase
MIKTISYLGLGTMGSGMASNLLKAGYKLSLWNRSPEKCKPFARKGARVAESPADAVRDVDLVMYSLSNDQAVEKVVFGAKGILTGINAGQIAMDMSTVLPATSHEHGSARDQLARTGSLFKARRGLSRCARIWQQKGIRERRALDYGRGQKGRF